MLLYFIRDMGITILGETKTEQQFAGIKHWIPEREDLSDEYLYLCDGAHIPEKTQILSQTVCMLVIFSQKEAGQKNQEQRKEWRQFHNNLICIETEKSVPEVMNALVEIFYRLVEWDKNMHIAALEGKDVQELIDISEPVLEYPMIVFDASFDVLAYTKHCESHYKTFWETVQQGYTDAHTMEQLKKKQIFSQIREGEMLIAPSAENAGTNIYLQFFSGQTLLGYTSFFCGDHSPEDGYLDLVRMFMKNMSFICSAIMKIRDMVG